MKRKYVELNTNNIEEYSDNTRNILSYYIAMKQDNIRYVNYYNTKLNGVNEELSVVLKEIDKLINEINELSKRISSLEKGKFLVAYNHNLLLGNKDKNSINKINDARYFYFEIIDELNRLISYRDELRDNLKDNKDRKNVLVSERKKYNIKVNRCVSNVDICNYNIKKCHKTLNRIDNIYFYKTDKALESFFMPKVKKIKY